MTKLAVLATLVVAVLPASAQASSARWRSCGALTYSAGVLRTLPSIEVLRDGAPGAEAGPFSCACAHDGSAAARPPEAIPRTSRVPRRSFAARRASRCPPGARNRAAAPACAAPRVPLVSPRPCFLVSQSQRYASDVLSPRGSGRWAQRLVHRRAHGQLAPEFGEKEAGAAVVVRATQRSARARGFGSAG